MGLGISFSESLKGDFQRARVAMPLNLEEAKKLAIKDLSERLKASESDVSIESTDSVDFPNASLGAERPGEMSAQMMISGWRLRLQCNGRSYEYRAARNQMRLFDFNGQNYKIYP